MHTNNTNIEMGDKRGIWVSRKFLVGAGMANV